MLRKSHNPVPSKSFCDVQSKCRQDLIDDNIRKFGEQTIGIHGQELPKFAENDESKPYWLQDAAQPEIQSRAHLIQE